jgi:hypothetical protein
MAKRQPPRKRTRKSKIEQAKTIIRSMTGKGFQRAKLVQARVEAAGISTRTYRTARKQMKAIASRTSIRGARRGRGRWFVKSRKYSRK